jgi:hypothetical protein
VRVEKVEGDDASILKYIFLFLPLFLTGPTRMKMISDRVSGGNYSCLIIATSCMQLTGYPLPPLIGASSATGEKVGVIKRSVDQPLLKTRHEPQAQASSPAVSASSPSQHSTLRYPRSCQEP